MATVVYGLNDLLLDAVEEPAKKFFEKATEDTIDQFLARSYPSVGFDFSHLWVSAGEALTSAMLGGLGFAGIRFLFAILLMRPDRPKYMEKIEFAQYMYGKYGDSTFFGPLFWVWRFNKLNDTSTELDKAFCKAKTAGKYHDARRINLLQALIAQAAHVWHEADMHFKPFVEFADRKVIELKSALDLKTKDLDVPKFNNMPFDHRHIVNQIMQDARTKQFVAERRPEALVKAYAGKLAKDERAKLELLIEEAVLVARIQKYETFLAFARYRPAFRESWNYRVDRLQDVVCRSRLFQRLSSSRRDFAMRAFGKGHFASHAKSSIQTSA